MIGPLQKASGPRKKEKTAMSHFWDTHHKRACGKKAAGSNPRSPAKKPGAIRACGYQGVRAPHLRYAPTASI